MSDPKSIISYVPHGINHNIYKPLPKDDPRILEMKANMFKGEDLDFVVLYNNRNIRRKCTGNVILAFKQFYSTLTDEQKKKVKLILHTQPVDQHGTDLYAVLKGVAPEIPAIFSEARLIPSDLNCVYNLCDITINLANAEGFGLATAESVMAGTCMLATVTGGLQDQMGFKDENGNYLNHETHFNKDWMTNDGGKYKEHGEWAFPIFPATRSLIGSPDTPFINENVCKWEDAGNSLREAYDVGREGLKARALKGREYFLGAGGLSAENMSNQLIHGIDSVFATWKPRKRFDIYKI